MQEWEGGGVWDEGLEAAADGLEWKVKESVGADVLGGPQPQSNANRVVGRLRAAEDVRPYRRHRVTLMVG